jgi:transcription-repair coupling factor (superfamily II helicase)
MTLSGILSIFDQLPAYQKVNETVRSNQHREPLRLPTSGRAPILSRLFLDQTRPILLITGRVDAVAQWQQALETWLPDEQVILRFTEPTPLPYERGPWSSRSRLDRLTVFTRLLAGQHPLIPAAATPPLIVTSARALLQKTLPRSRFIAATRVLKPGQMFDLEKTLQAWQESGYEAITVVEAPGQFSRRGGILDLYPANSASLPVRIELFGDEIDTIRYFDPATQRSLDGQIAPVTRVIVPPAREAMPAVAQGLGAYLEGETQERDDDLPSWEDDIADLLTGQPSPHLEYYLPLMYSQPGTLLDYLPENALVVVDDWLDLLTAARELHNHADQLANEQTSLPPDYPNPLFAWDDMTERLSGKQPLILGDSAEGDNAPISELADHFQTGPRYGGQVRPLMAQLSNAQANNETTILVSRQAQRLAELWRNEIVETALQLPPIHPAAQLLRLPEKPLTFVQGSLAEGFNLDVPGQSRLLLSLLTDAEIFGWKRPEPRRRFAPRAAAPETPFADIQPGDYIVHLEYGIGQFQGLVVRTVGGNEREYLQISYAGTDTLYVPVHHADRLSKWIGSEERAPTINRLGEKGWKAAKARAQRAVDELADELIELYSARETIPGHAFSPDTEWQAEMEASFPYRETEDQLRVVQEVKQDMERAYPMDRLVCGDVGFGKTEVALRAAFKAVMDGKQVAILVPTTILAQQHYVTFQERLKPFPVTVEMLSRFRTAHQQTETLKSLREGKVDVIIGTHRLLSDDVSFKDLGLLVIDEEQRFGVAHKERLKQLRIEVDVLTMTATPIPRTLYMGLAGVRDVSLIETPPLERLPVQTYVGESDDQLIRRAILRELERGGQIFFVHNRVLSIEVIEKRLHKLVPEARIAIAHGQLPERKLEHIMEQFVNKEIDILVSTTIVENGLDIPNANTLIVDKAEMFGLSQLYQLRGRVGRGTQLAYAYFFHGKWRSLGQDSQARLETIAENTQLGAGYAIAMRDLEIRGAGDILGGQQSGHISEIGFDLYTRMLSRAVAQRKAQRNGTPLPADIPDATLIDLPLAAYVPTDYLPDPALRLRLYRRMAQMDSLESIDAMAGELADRFGPIPDPVDNLLYQLRIKYLAAKARIASVVSENGQIRIKLDGLEQLDRYHLQRQLGAAVRVSRNAIWLNRDLPTHEWQINLVQILEKLENLNPPAQVSSHHENGNATEQSNLPETTSN